jgi:hypothetical protein
LDDHVGSGVLAMQIGLLTLPYVLPFLEADTLTPDNIVKAPWATTSPLLPSSIRLFEDV